MPTFRISSLAAVAAFLLSACASAPAPAPAAGAAAAPTTTTTTASAAEQACLREFPTGSTIAVTRCRNKEQVASDRTAADATADQIRNTSRTMRDPVTNTGR